MSQNNQVDFAALERFGAKCTTLRKEVAKIVVGQDAVIEQLGPIARVDTMARLEGRNMTMVLSPDKKAAKRPVSAKPAVIKPATSNPPTISNAILNTTTETEKQNAEDENIQDSQEAI